MLASTMAFPFYYSLHYRCYRAQVASSLWPPDSTQRSPLLAPQLMPRPPWLATPYPAPMGWTLSGPWLYIFYVLHMLSSIKCPMWPNEKQPPSILHVSTGSSFIDILRNVKRFLGFFLGQTIQESAKSLFYVRLAARQCSQRQVFLWWQQSCPSSPE